MKRLRCWLLGHRVTSGIAKVRGGMGTVSLCARCGQQRRLV